ncbi:MAG: antitoxin family protein [Pirellulales bacterium]
MSIQIEATYRDGVIHPNQPLDLPDNTPVSVVVPAPEEVSVSFDRIYSPQLAHPEQASDFVMEVREASDSRGLPTLPLLFL